MRITRLCRVALLASALIAAARGPQVDVAVAAPPPRLALSRPAPIVSNIPCFWLEPIDQVARSLRRYTQDHKGGWTCQSGWHEALVALDTVPAIHETSDSGRRYLSAAILEQGRPADDDARWPTSCAKGCGFQFTDRHVRQVFTDSLYQRADTGEIMTLRTAPAGALWDAFWLPDSGTWRGADGRALMVKTPGGDWHVDGRASNCTMPNDTDHKCWVRHGVPPLITVDKNGRTCGAGAGSIQAGSYHGFLRNGVLVQA